MYVYEAVLKPCEEGGYYIEVPQFAGCFADGDSIAEAVENCAIALQLAIADMVDGGEVLPKPEFSDPPKTVLCVEVSDDFIAASKCLTIVEAAEELGITHGRVCQLLDSGDLEAFMHGGRRMVTIASVNARKRNKRSAGRPRKEE